MPTGNSAHFWRLPNRLLERGYLSTKAVDFLMRFSILSAKLTRNSKLSWKRNQIARFGFGGNHNVNGKRIGLDLQRSTSTVSLSSSVYWASASVWQPTCKAWHCSRLPGNEKGCLSHPKWRLTFPLLPNCSGSAWHALSEAIQYFMSIQEFRISASSRYSLHFLSVSYSISIGNGGSSGKDWFTKLLNASRLDE